MDAGRWESAAHRAPLAHQVMVGSAYFGHALLVELLLPKLRTSAPARVVWMSGALEAQAKLDWGDLGCACAYAAGQSRRVCVHIRGLLAAAAGDLHMLGRQQSESLQWITGCRLACRGHAGHGARQCPASCLRNLRVPATGWRR